MMTSKVGTRRFNNNVSYLEFILHLQLPAGGVTQQNVARPTDSTLVISDTVFSWFSKKWEGCIA